MITRTLNRYYNSVRRKEDGLENLLTFGLTVKNFFRWFALFVFYACLMLIPLSLSKILSPSIILRPFFPLELKPAKCSIKFPFRKIVRSRWSFGFSRSNLVVDIPGDKNFFFSKYWTWSDMNTSALNNRFISNSLSIKFIKYISKLPQYIEFS